MGLLKSFKEFISRGNVIDLAVGVIVGAAFGRIIASFVEDILMPPLGLLMDQNFTNLKWILKPAANPDEVVAINYGNFLQNLIDFLIVAFALFLIIRAVTVFYKSKAKDAPKEEVVLLEKILTELKKSK